MKIISKKLKEKSGITLIELIIAMSIALIVTVAALTLLDFGETVYNNGSNQYNLQSNARLTIQQIMREIRYATEVSILGPSDSIPADNSSLIEGEGYIYYDTTNGSINIMNSSFNTAYIIGETPTSNVQFSKQINSPLLDYIISGTDKNNSYNLGSSILCLNLQLKNTGINGENSGVAIYYRKDISIAPSTSPSASISPSPGVPSPSPVVDKPYIEILLNGTSSHSYILRDSIINTIVEANISSFLSGKCNTTDFVWDDDSIELKVNDVKNGYEAIFTVKYNDNKIQSFKVEFDNIGGWSVVPTTILD